MRPAPALAGLIEVRGLGIRHVPHEPLAVVGLVVDLGQPDAERLPDRGPNSRPKSRESPCRGLRSQPAPTPCPLVLAYLQTAGRPGLIVAVRKAWKSLANPHIYGPTARR